MTFRRRHREVALVAATILATPAFAARYRAMVTEMVENNVSLARLGVAITDTAVVIREAEF